MLNTVMEYHVAMYLRLSKDDGDISHSEKKLESDSIQNQRELLRAFLKKQPEDSSCSTSIRTMAGQAPISTGQTSSV